MKIIKKEANGRDYYTSSSQALCPYTCITEEEILAAPKPLIMESIHPDLGIGIKGPLLNRAIIDIPPDWSPKRKKEWRQIRRRNEAHRIDIEEIEGNSLDLSTVRELGGDHLERIEIIDEEIEGLLDFVAEKTCIIITVVDGEKTIAIDFSTIDGQMIHGIFCNWDREYKFNSPGLFSTLICVEYAEKRGLKVYNMGVVEDHDYKLKLATRLEQSCGIVFCDEDEPLVEEWGIPRDSINRLKM
jgi:hypothetical protein